MKAHGSDSRFREVEEMMGAMLRFPGDALAQFFAGFGTPGPDMYRVIGTAGEITLDPAFEFKTATRMRLSRNGEIAHEHQFPLTDHFAGQTAYFSDCILDGVRPEADGEEGLADIRVLRAIERATLTGAPQRIDIPPRHSHPSARMVRRFPPTDRRLVL